jgi:hypothetical protein
MEDAIEIALRSNHDHGLRRTRADIANAIKIALTTFPDWTDRRIAETVGVIPSTVAAHQKKLRKSVVQIKQQTRTGKDGRQYRARKGTAKDAETGKPEGAEQAAHDTQPKSVKGAEAAEAASGVEQSQRKLTELKLSLSTIDDMLDDLEDVVCVTIGTFPTAVAQPRGKWRRSPAA